MTQVRRRLPSVLGGWLVTRVALLAADDADLGYRGAQQARDLHLRHPHSLRDLRLGQVARKPQVEDHPISLRQPVDALGDHRQVLGQLKLLVLGAEHLCTRASELVVFVRAAVQRRRVARVVGLERIEGLLLADAESFGELTDRRRAAESRGQLLGRSGQLEGALLDPARHVQGPRAVPEMTLELAEDRRRRVARERKPAFRVELDDRFQQPEPRHLNQVLQWLAFGCIAQGQFACQRLEPPHQLLLNRTVRLVVMKPEQFVGVKPADLGHHAEASRLRATAARWITSVNDPPSSIIATLAPSTPSAASELDNSPTPAATPR